MFTKTDIERYFIAEKKSALLFGIIGGIAVILALLFYIIKGTAFHAGVAIPFITFGLLFAIIGYTIYRRTDKDLSRNNYAFDLNPSQLKLQELPRMQKVVRQFSVYLVVEIILLIAGICLFIFTDDQPRLYFWKGVGAGVGIMCLMALATDLVAAQRAKVYTKGLISFTQHH